jgi:hypothetical protein
MPLLAAALLALLLEGCSLWQAIAPAPAAPRTEPRAMAYNENSVRCLALGRRYQAEGRFELARETFMHGLATARDDAMRETLSREVEATDRIILSNR